MNSSELNVTRSSAELAALKAKFTAWFDANPPRPTQLIIPKDTFEGLRRRPKMRRFLREYAFKRLWLKQPKFKARVV